MKKHTTLKKYLSQFDRLAIAFSGGVDSTFLTAVAADVLGAHNILALTAVHEFVPTKETQRAKRIARALRVPHHIVPFSILKDSKLKKNHPERCYFCKKKIFSSFVTIAKRKGFPILCDASNKDDLAVHRPGNKAAIECTVRRPLVECSFTKKDIRTASRRKGLETWNAPSEPCLATRFPYGWSIDKEALRRVELAEEYIRNLGFPVVRLRAIPLGVRIEVPTADLRRIIAPKTRKEVSRYLKRKGYQQIVLDLEGYRSGSMDEGWKT